VEEGEQGRQLDGCLLIDNSLDRETHKLSRPGRGLVSQCPPTSTPVPGLRPQAVVCEEAAT
jgi:hypothetical protein